MRPLLRRRGEALRGSGRTNAAVLPVPVCAQPRTSRPCEHVRDAALLNGRGRLVALGGDGTEERSREAESGEGARPVRLRLVEAEDAGKRRNVRLRGA